jgi:hypothetical protein
MEISEIGCNWAHFCTQFAPEIDFQGWRQNETTPTAGSSYLEEKTGTQLQLERCASRA